jgi:integrase
VARLFKRTGDDHWWLDYTDGAGKRHREKTSTTSRRVAEDLLAEVRAKATRAQLGLEVAPSTTSVRDVGAAWDTWLDNWCTPASLKKERSRFNANVRDSWLARVKLAELTGEHLDRFFAERRKAGLSATSVNALRRVLRNVYNSLARNRKFRGANPVTETRPLEEPQYAYQLLTEAEVRRVLPHVPAHWRDLVHLAFTTGLRRGELFALRKDRSVVDLERATLTPRASNARPMTKGKRVKSIPLTPDALEVLQRAWDATEPGELLFPRPGKPNVMRSEHSKTSRMVKAAMVRAGLVEGWEHVCRRGCDEKQVARDEQQRRCSKCHAILWPKPIVRGVRFHDLRHSAADHLLEHGVELADVSQFLRHADLAITNKTYRHRTVEALRKAVTKPSAGALERHLEALMQGQTGEVLEALKAAREKLALARHQTSNVVPFLGATKR